MPYLSDIKERFGGAGGAGSAGGMGDMLGQLLGGGGGTSAEPAFDEPAANELTEVTEPNIV